MAISSFNVSSKSKSKKVKFVCTSDTHGRIQDPSQIPTGDVFLHAGDFSMRGTTMEVKQFNDFLGKLPHRYKVLIAGNHEECLSMDHSLDPNSTAALNTKKFLKEQFGVSRNRDLFTNCIYLEDEAVDLYGIRIYGSPWSPRWGTACCAFQKASGPAMEAKWKKIPDHVDILMTHGPPLGICDRVNSGSNVGCKDLLTVVERIKPKYHVFGHIHEGYGRFYDGTTTFINASMCNTSYRPCNPPVVFEMNGYT